MFVTEASVEVTFNIDIEYDTSDLMNHLSKRIGCVRETCSVYGSSWLTIEIPRYDSFISSKLQETIKVESKVWAKNEEKRLEGIINDLEEEQKEFPNCESVKEAITKAEYELETLKKIIRDNLT